jgi:predicted ATPase/tetratricopeptide (TPR) repeat protein
MGIVHRGTDLRTGAAVAIKQLRLDIASPAEGLERFRREGEALQRLNHPNIVRVLELARERETDYIVMEYIGGGSLQNLLESRASPLPIEGVLNLALDLCDALTRVHRLEIIHRDLKPSNVLIADDGTPRLTDFGAAYMVGKERVTAAASIVGTTEYLSPEALGGEDLDARADIWAFGVILFEMLTLRRPFSEHNLARTLHNISFSSPPDLELLRPDCPAALADLVHGMLVKDRNQRVPSARQVGAALDDIQSGHAHRGGLGRGPLGVAARAEPPAALAIRPRREPLPNNLSAATSTFVGRQRELAELQQRLQDPAVRLITLVAPGGMGKTRLALELGHRMLAGALVASAGDRAVHGIFLVRLVALSSSELIVSAIAEAVGFQFYPGADLKGQLLSHLRDKQMLLLLDNFEHLLDGAAFVSELLEAGKDLTVLATSRERLGLRAETVFPLSGMEVPEGPAVEGASEFSAVRLFMQGARQQRPGFELDSESATAAVRICRLVQGIPLGILLSAAWAGTLSFREIAEEIDKGLDFLASEMRDLPDRQRSMRAVFDHSWNLLNEHERDALSGLSVFRGGFTRAAAQAVAQTSIRVLAALMDKSLLRRNASSGRFEAHDLLRQYAEQKLLESPCRHEMVHDRHARYFASYVHAREVHLQGPNPGGALADIEVEIENERVAWAHMLAQQQLDSIEQVMGPLYLFHTRRASFGEAEASFGALVESLRASSSRPATARILGQALSLQAMSLRQQGRYAHARALLDEALAILDEQQHPRQRAFALVACGSTKVKSGSLEEGKALAESGIRLYRSTDDAWGLASSLETLGRLYATGGELAKAEDAYRESASLQRGSGMLPSGLMGLGIAMAQQGNYGEGCRLMRDALDTFEKAGDRWNQMRCRMNLANAQRNLGNYPQAEALAQSCLAFAREVGNWDHEAWSHFQLGNILKEQQRYDEAAPHYVAAHQRSIEAGDAGKIALAKLEFGDLAMIHGEYGKSKQYLNESLSGFESSGQTWGTALALDLLGYVACHEGDWSAARRHYQRALRTALSFKLYPFAANVVAGMALWLARTGEAERAVELLALTQHHPATERHTLTRRVGPLIAELKRSLDDALFAAAVARGTAMQLEAVAHL